jgi:transcriptional regulator with XRE-family HTH domain
MLSKYESGIHVPSLKRAYAMARALAVPVDLLLPGFDFLEPVDRELYRQFRRIWLEPLPIRSLALQTLKLALELLQSPHLTPGDPNAAPRR